MQSRLLMRRRVCSEAAARLLNGITPADATAREATAWLLNGIARADATARVQRGCAARLLNAIMPADATAHVQRGYGSAAHPALRLQIGSCACSTSQRHVEPPRLVSLHETP